MNKTFASSSEKMVDSISSTVTPPYLKAGDTVAITCPDNALDIANIECYCNTLSKWGLNVKSGKTVAKRSRQFSSTDKERLEDFQELIDDPSIKAIIFGTGDYGTMRIIDKIRWDKFKQHPKWLVGRRDLTVVHLHVYSNLNLSTIHGDMSENPSDDLDLSLKQSLFGTKTEYQMKSFEMNRIGKVQGKLVGGNLTLIQACTATRSDMNTNGKILFIEDVSEYKYNIDRMMMSLKRAGKLDKLAGLVVGEFARTRNNEDDTYNTRVEDIIWDKVKDYGYPVCFHFPAGHIVANRALKMGVNYELNVGRDTVSLAEIVPPPPPVNVNIFQS